MKTGSSWGVAMSEYLSLRNRTSVTPEEGATGMAVPMRALQDDRIVDEVGLRPRAVDFHRREGIHPVRLRAELHRSPLPEPRSAE